MKPGGLCVLGLLCLVSAAYADVHAARGTVRTLHSHDPSDSTDADWVSLAGIKSMGRCKSNEAGDVVLLVPDGRMFQLALAAKASGGELTIWTDDAVTSASGFCVVSDME